MHITMVKKRLADGSECRKCQDASSTLQTRGLWSRIDDVVWAKEGDDASPGMVLAARLGVEQAPFFIVRDGSAEQVYTSVLQLVRDRLRQEVTSSQQAAAIDPDDIGGI
jgi:hypothetical protein